MCPSTVAIPWARGFVEPKRFPRAQGRSGTNLFQTTVTKQAVLLSSSFVRDAFRGILRVRVLSAEGPAGRYRPRDRVEDAGRPERPWRAEGLVWAVGFEEHPVVMKALSSLGSSEMLSIVRWILESQVVVVKDHRDMLKKCGKAGSVTARLVAVWAPIMCFPQWVGGLLFGLLGYKAAWAIFSARMGAMCIVRKLDEHIPFTRALGLCHLLTFGPVLAFIMNRAPAVPVSDATSVDSYFLNFLAFEKGVIALCLFMDARDLILHCLGYPFPCYIREGVRAGLIPIADPRAKHPVTVSSRLFGP
ncbi:unnamed protein product [Durusdinium trenchii]|uniref:Uncharacterized protein n=2 Tax=Durusdinium trenchii TaxID=1381693 RepID=A0ABP0SY38_9DINO